MSAPVIEVRHLRLVLAVEAAGNLRLAAERLHLTPSALSQQLRELEARLGGPLFRRTWRRLVPTAAGARLVDLARVTVPDVVRAEAEVRALAQGARGAVRFASGCHLSYRWFPDVLAAFAAVRPDVDVALVPEAANTPDSWLRDRRLDVALTIGRRPVAADLRAARLFRDEVVAVVGRGHAWWGQEAVNPAAFADEHYCGEPTLLRPDRCLGRALAPAHVTPRKVTPTAMADGTALELVRANLGVTVMAQWAVSPYAAAGEVHPVRVGARGLWTEWVLVTREEPAEPALRIFLETFEAHHPLAGGRPRARPPLVAQDARRPTSRAPRTA